MPSLQFPILLWLRVGVCLGGSSDSSESDEDISDAEDSDSCDSDEKEESASRAASARDAGSGSLPPALRDAVVVGTVRHFTPWISGEDGYEMHTDVHFPQACALATSVPAAASGGAFWSCEALRVGVTMRGGLGHADRFTAKYDIESVDTEAVLLRDHVRIFSALGVDWAWAGANPPADEVIERLRFAPAVYEVGVLLHGGYCISLVTNDDNVVDDFADSSLNGYALVRGTRLSAGTQTGFERYRAPTVETTYSVDLGAVTVALRPQPSAGSGIGSGGDAGRKAFVPSSKCDSGCENGPVDNALQSNRLNVSGSYMFHRQGLPGGFGAPDCATTLVKAEGLRALVEGRVLGALGKLAANYFGSASFVTSTQQYWAESESDDRGVLGWNLGARHAAERAAVRLADARAADPALPRPNKFETVLRVVLADCTADLPEYKVSAASASGRARPVQGPHAFTREAIIEMRGVPTYSDLTVTVDPVSLRLPSYAEPGIDGAQNAGSLAADAVSYIRIDGVEYHTHTYAGPQPLQASYRSFASLRIGLVAAALKPPDLLSLARWATNIAPPPPPPGPGGAPPGRFWRRHRTHDTMQAEVGQLRAVLRGPGSLSEFRADKGLRIHTDNRVGSDGHNFARLTLPLLSATVNAMAGNGLAAEATEVARLECQLEVFHRIAYTRWRRDEEEQTEALRFGDRDTSRIPPELLATVHGGARDSGRGTPLVRSVSGISQARSDQEASEACRTAPTSAAVVTASGTERGGGFSNMAGDEDFGSASQEFLTASAGYCTASEGDLSDEEEDGDKFPASKAPGGPRFRQRCVRHVPVAMFWGDVNFPELIPVEALAVDTDDDGKLREDSFFAPYWSHGLFPGDGSSQAGTSGGPLSPMSASSSAGIAGHIDGEAGEDIIADIDGDWERSCTEIVLQAVRVAVCPHALEAAAGWVAEGPLPSWTVDGCLAHIAASLPPPPQQPSFAFPGLHRVSAVMRVRSHCMQLLFLERPAAIGSALRAVGIAVGAASFSTENVTWHPGCLSALTQAEAFKEERRMAALLVNGHPFQTSVTVEEGMLEAAVGQFGLWSGAIEPFEMLAAGGLPGKEVTRVLTAAGFAPPSAVNDASAEWQLRVAALIVGSGSPPESAQSARESMEAGPALKVYIARHGAGSGAAGEASAEAATVKVLIASDAPSYSAPILLLCTSIAGDVSKLLAQRRRVMQRNLALVLDQAVPQMLRVGRARSHSLGAWPDKGAGGEEASAGLPLVALLRRSRSEEPGYGRGNTADSNAGRGALPKLRRGQSDDGGRANWRIEARWHVWLVRRYLRECSAEDLRELEACLRLPETWKFVSRHSWARLGGGVGGDAARDEKNLRGFHARLSIGHVELDMRQPWGCASCNEFEEGGSRSCLARLRGVRLQGAVSNPGQRRPAGQTTTPGRGEPAPVGKIGGDGSRGQHDVAAWGHMGQIEVECLPSVLDFVRRLLESIGKAERAQIVAVRVSVKAAFTPLQQQEHSQPSRHNQVGGGSDGKAVSFAPLRREEKVNGAAKIGLRQELDPVVFSAGRSAVGESRCSSGATCVLLPLRGVLKRIELVPAPHAHGGDENGGGGIERGCDGIGAVEPAVAYALASEMAAAANGSGKGSGQSFRRTTSLPSHAALRTAKSVHLSASRRPMTDLDVGNARDTVLSRSVNGVEPRPAQPVAAKQSKIQLHLQASLSGRIRLLAPRRGTVELELSRGLVSFSQSLARRPSITTSTPATHQTACLSVVQACARLHGPSPDAQQPAAGTEAWASIALEDLRVIGSRAVRAGVRRANPEASASRRMSRNMNRSRDEEPDATEGEHEFRTLVRT